MMIFIRHLKSTALAWITFLRQSPHKVCALVAHIALSWFVLTLLNVLCVAFAVSVFRLVLAFFTLPARFLRKLSRR